jgi:predicted nucleic acid-binding protein
MNDQSKRDKMHELWAKLEAGPHHVYLQGKAMTAIMALFLRYARDTDTPKEQSHIELDYLRKSLDIHEMGLQLEFATRVTEAAERSEGDMRRFHALMIAYASWLLDKSGRSNDAQRELSNMAELILPSLREKK